MSNDWSDDQKALILFSPFRNKEVNPVSFDNKMKFWTNAILERSKLDGDLLLNKKTILCKFQRCGKYPKCLSTVIDELVR